jgi:predicted TIM-barrel fold metal-dependent hydrolase
MKSLATIAVLSALLLGSVAGGQAAQDEATLLERVAALETEVVALRKQLDEKRGLSAAVELELARAQETTSKLLTYLHTRAQDARAVLTALDQSEAEGFTAGINARSRETLLAGFRAWHSGAEKGLPPAPKATADEEE